jgi:Rad3-related DNA helicase
LADFAIGPRRRFGGQSGTWRAELGREWHSSLRAKSELLGNQEGEVRHEVSVRGILLRGGWAVELEGRVDKLIENNGLALVSELKTTFVPLPASEESLREKYPHYFLQVSIYVLLFRLLPDYSQKQVVGELRFADVSGGGFIQTLPIEPCDDIALEEQIKVLLEFLEERHSSHQRLSKLSFNKPFDTLREGQAETQMCLEQSFTTAPVTLFEAPTGFGKTGTALSFALERLRDGFCDRILYLTSKSTGQNEVASTLGKMIPDACGFRYLCLQNRTERNIGFEDLEHLSEQELAYRWKSAALNPLDLFSGATISENNLIESAKYAGIPPYEIIRACLPFAELWLGDFNYVFQPRSNSIFRSVEGFIPARSLLLVDEAHNLPERVASSLSARFAASDAVQLIEHLLFVQAPKALIRALEDWAEFLDSRRQNEIVDADNFYKATELVETVAETIAKGPIPCGDLPGHFLDDLWRYGDTARLLAFDALPKHLWVPKNRCLEITCLDASVHIGSEVRSFALCLMESATLSPMDQFAISSGLQPSEYRTIYGSAPWRDLTLKVAIDIRGDTRFSRRHRYLDEIATAVLALIKTTKKPAIIYFSSFRYATEANNRLGEISPQTKVVLQPRFGSQRETNQFIDTAFVAGDAIFLVLGSVFAEGVDFLGGKVDAAMIVGPALPEVNALQKAKMDTCSGLDREEAFRRTYLIPGMRKVNQALGRLVRSPEHRARVILHCRRFDQPAFRALLDPVCREAPPISCIEGIEAWLEGEENSVA